MISKNLTGESLVLTFHLDLINIIQTLFKNHPITHPSLQPAFPAFPWFTHGDSTEVRYCEAQGGEKTVVRRGEIQVLKGFWWWKMMLAKL